MKALGAPGVVAYRGLRRVIGLTSTTNESYDPRNDAGRLAHAFLSLFNSVEVMDLLRGNTKEDAYWKSVLEYAIGGNIQAMLDEYVHVLVESLNLKDMNLEKRFQQLVGEIGPAMSLRTSLSQADMYKTAPRQLKCEVPVRLRNHFAMRFGDQSDGNDNMQTSKGNVQKAFNSPLWPFVLASTSVGQEGLDFHPYCHAVVHWNLPSNPVDLEQREGRVHRYKGHAVRKNIARAYSTAAPHSGGGDPWESMFQQAVAKRAPSHNDLYPFWISSDNEPGVGDRQPFAKIERHVPVFAHSREVTQQAHLQKALVLYRMVFGQNRQDDLIAYLQAKFSESQVRDLIETCRIDLSPKTNPVGCENRPVSR